MLAVCWPHKARLEPCVLSRCSVSLTADASA